MPLTNEQVKTRCKCGHDAGSHDRCRGHCRAPAGPRGISVEGICRCKRFHVRSQADSQPEALTSELVQYIGTCGLKSLRYCRVQQLCTEWRAQQAEIARLKEEIGEMQSSRSQLMAKLRGEHPDFPIEMDF